MQGNTKQIQEKKVNAIDPVKNPEQGHEDG